MPSSSRERLFERLNWHPSFLLRPFRRVPFRVAGEGEPLRRRLAALRGRAAPMWSITTYERPDACERLVESLALAARALGIEPVVVVFRDAGPSDYTAVREALERGFGARGLLLEATRHLAKKEHWRLHQQIMNVVRALAPPYHLSLQDDIEFVPGWHEQIWSIVEDIGDPDIAMLYLAAADDDEKNGRWIEFERQPAAHGRAWLTQWVELQAHVAFPRMFEALAWRMIPVDPSRWVEDPTKSTGVARQLTRRLFMRPVNVYQVSSTLVYHGAHASLMNPEARAVRALDNRPQT